MHLMHYQTYHLRYQTYHFQILVCKKIYPFISVSIIQCQSSNVSHHACNKTSNISLSKVVIRWSQGHFHQVRIMQGYGFDWESSCLFVLFLLVPIDVLVGRAIKLWLDWPLGAPTVSAVRSLLSNPLRVNAIIYVHAQIK